MVSKQLPDEEREVKTVTGGLSFCSLICVRMNKEIMLLKVSIVIKMLLFLFLLFPTLQAEQSLSGKVLSVPEGDMIRLLDNGKKLHNIRLAGIDAPEKKQDFGNKAQLFLGGLVKKQFVRVEIVGLDKNDQPVGQVYNKDRYVNKEMIKHGYAWVWHGYYDGSEVKESNVESRDIQEEYKEFKDFESLARESKMGLWRNTKAVPPWEFRKNHP